MNYFFQLLLLIACCFTIIPLSAQETFPRNGVADHREGYYAFTNATIYTRYDQKLENATLVIRKGKVVAVGNNLSVPEGAVQVDLSGKFIYPSFIETFASYGIPEAEVIKKNPTKRPQFLSNKEGAYSWNESLQTEFTAHENFTPDAKVAKSWRKLGFGTVLAHQANGISRGSGTIVLLGDDRAHELMVKEKASHHLSFRKGKSTQNYPGSLMGAIALLRQTYLDGEWYEKTGRQEEVNLSLEAWNQLQPLPQIFAVDNKLEVLRAATLGAEFGQKYIIKGSGDEYQRTQAIKATGSALILPLNFPDAFDVEDPFDAQQVTLQQMKHWELAPANPALIDSAGISFCLTTDGLKKKTDFKNKLLSAIERGLSKTAALKALTYTPARLLKVEDQLGSLEKGKLANFLIASGDIFEKKTKLHHNWVKGKPYEITSMDEPELEGNYKLRVGDKSYELVLGKKEAHIQENDTTEIKVKYKQERDLIQLSFKIKEEGHYSLSGTVTDQSWSGRGTDPKGNWLSWDATLQEGDIESEDKMKEEESDEKEAEKSEAGSIIFPFIAYGWEEMPKAGTYLFKNATVWTNEAEGILQNTDVLIENGKISQIGKSLTSRNATTIDATGKHLTCGIVDEHSHIAVSRGVNEGTQASSAEVRIGDVVNSEDINIYRQLSGGVTTSQLLHGSANPIGGQSALIKLRWGKTPEEMKFEGAAPFIKFALGENVKQSNWGDNNTTRFPQTRMGVEQVFEDYFTRAREYGDLISSGKPYRRDLDLEALLEILEGERFITCHSYRQSEINMLMKVAERHGFKVNTFTHILEGYKLADIMKEHGAAGSTFSDWWAYKFEVIEAIPYNGAVMHEQGVLTGFNSDDAEMARRLNQEAAKAVMYGGVSEEDAWKFVTLNPAKMLHIDDRVGSIKKGKDADIVLWSEHPLSISAKAELTFVDGIKYFDREADKQMRAVIRAERSRLIEKMLADKRAGKPTKKPGGKAPHLYHCDDLHDEMK
jgi:imidazolonepropionase-like amidohydrolase